MARAATSKKTRYKKAIKVEQTEDIIFTFPKKNIKKLVGFKKVCDFIYFVFDQMLQVRDN
jgi:hypothetical protein